MLKLGEVIAIVPIQSSKNKTLRIAIKWQVKALMKVSLLHPLFLEFFFKLL